MTVASPLRLLLDSAALVANWQRLKTLSGAAACGAAVKADGYGLGARAVTARLAAAGCRDFFVATWAEAEALGAMPAGCRLSVLHGVRDDDMAFALRPGPIRPVLNSAAQVARWRQAGGGACDVMVDTGMNRLGLTPEEACSGLLDDLPIDTLMSHFACADEPGHPLNTIQPQRFAAVRARVEAERYSLANSAGVLLGRDHALDLTRPGLALYGGNPVRGSGDMRAGLLPVVAVEADLLQVRDVPVGDSVGYGAAWVARRRSRIGIVNLGYADGLLNQLAGGLTAVVAGQEALVVGRISMDLIAIDLTGVEREEGGTIRFPLDLPRLALLAQMSQYEILTGLGTRFERIWVS
jgi:alanine racemase